MLGCGTHEAWIYDRRGERPVFQLPKLLATSWERLLDDTSEGSVLTEVPDGDDCCTDLSRIEPWHHTLKLFRTSDEARTNLSLGVPKLEPVWEGPIENLFVRRGSVRVQARDVTAWSDHRIFKGVLQSTPNEVTDEFRLALAHCFNDDDPNVMAHVQTIPAPTTATIQRTQPANQGYYGEELRALAKAGVNWTVLGRSIIYWSEFVTLGGLEPMIAGKHFDGEIEVGVNGSNLATYLRSIHDVAEGDLLPAQIEYSSPAGIAYYGLLEYIQNLGEVSGYTADQMAQRDFKARYPVPTGMTVPQGGKLSPDSPYEISDLVPGVRIPLLVDEPLCRNVNGDFVLTRVLVEETPEGGETVKLDLAPIGTDGVTQKYYAPNYKRYLQYLHRELDPVFMHSRRVVVRSPGGLFGRTGAGWRY
jgi:hypothetical protein